MPARGKASDERCLPATRRVSRSMGGALERLSRAALRPLWREGELHRARRRCRALVALPFSALAGLVWGVSSAPAAGASPLSWGALGAFSFAFLMYLEQRLLPPLAAIVARDRPAGASAIASAVEGGVVAGIAFLLTGVLGAPVVSAVGTALGVGAAYAVLVEYLLCGGAAPGLAKLLQGSTGAWPRAAGHSRAEALLLQGEIDEAAALYERALLDHPRDGHAYVRLARIQEARGEHEAAVRTLRRALLKADLPLAQEVFVVRLVHEICATDLAGPEEAVEDVLALLERRPEGPHVEWAERVLSEMPGR